MSLNLSTSYQGRIQVGLGVKPPRKISSFAIKQLSGRYQDTYTSLCHLEFIIVTWWHPDTTHEAFTMSIFKLSSNTIFRSKKLNKIVRKIKITFYYVTSNDISDYKR